MTDEKWPAAQKNFEKAVEIDPDYAQAWSDLGEVLEDNPNPRKPARPGKAVQADPKYIKPYIQLARLDMVEKHPEDE